MGQIKALQVIDSKELSRFDPRFFVIKIRGQTGLPNRVRVRSLHKESAFVESHPSRKERD
jgi:hypothetical protein